jgi:hypothetical protein
LRKIGAPHEKKVLRHWNRHAASGDICGRAEQWIAGGQCKQTVPKTGILPDGFMRSGRQHPSLQHKKLLATALSSLTFESQPATSLISDIGSPLAKEADWEQPLQIGLDG